MQLLRYHHMNGRRRICKPEFVREGKEMVMMVGVLGGVLSIYCIVVGMMAMMGMVGRVSSTVVLITSTNQSLPFPDMEASFAPRIPGAGLIGRLYEANPLDACQSLINHPPSMKFPFLPFVIIARGRCTFETKVQNAQNAGFAAIIIYNNENNADLVTMSGNPAGIRIPAVFITKAAGDVLLKYVGDLSSRCYILPAFENTAWSVMAVSFISLLAVTVVLATFFFVRRHRLRHLGTRLRLAREPLSMSSREVKALPSFLFKCVEDGNATSETCVICLEDYNIGEKLRILPCHHEFHASCIDQWLTTRRPFCPVCKRDAHVKKGPLASENTPLLDAASRVSISFPQTNSSIGVQVSPSGSLHSRSVGSINRSYVSSAAGSLVEVNAHLSLEDTPNRSSVGSPADEHYSICFNDFERQSTRLPIPSRSSQFKHSSLSPELPEQALCRSSHSSQLSQSDYDLEFSPASQNGLDLCSVSRPSSTEDVTSAAVHPSRSQYRRAGSLNSLNHLFSSSNTSSHATGNYVTHQC